MQTTRLVSIATRQRTTRLHDVVFAACVALATIVSVSSIATAANAANVVAR